MSTRSNTFVTVRDAVAVDTAGAVWYDCGTMTVVWNADTTETGWVMTDDERIVARLCGRRHDDDADVRGLRDVPRATWTRLYVRGRDGDVVCVASCAGDRPRPRSTW